MTPKKLCPLYSKIIVRPRFLQNKFASNSNGRIMFLKKVRYYLWLKSKMILWNYLHIRPAWIDEADVHEVHISLSLLQDSSLVREGVYCRLSVNKIKDSWSSQESLKSRCALKFEFLVIFKSQPYHGVHHYTGWLLPLQSRSIIKKRTGLLPQFDFQIV